MGDIVAALLSSLGNHASIVALTILGTLLYVNIRDLNKRTDAINEDIKDIKTNVVWDKTCKADHKALKDSIVSIEKRVASIEKRL